MKIFVLLSLLLSASANAQPSDIVYLLGVGHVVSSATFVSDVTLRNAADDPIIVTPFFTPANIERPVTIRGDGIPLAPRQVLSLGDFLKNQMHIEGFGTVAFAGCKEGADCTGTSTVDYRPIDVESRIYSFASSPSGPTTGQDLPAVPWRETATSGIYSDAAGQEKLIIIGIKVSDVERTNIGAVNVSAFSSCILEMTLIDGTDQGVRDVHEVALAPSAGVLVNLIDAFPKLKEWSRLNRGRPVTNATITLTQRGVVPTADARQNGCIDGCPAFFAYGSQLDNRTTDATTLPARFMGERVAAPAQSAAIQPVAARSLVASAKGVLVDVNAFTVPPCIYQPELLSHGICKER